MVLDPFETLRDAGPASYLVLTLSVAGSVVFPPLPSETAIFTAGALAGLGVLNPILVAVCGGLGSLLGDVIGYLLGRLLGERTLRRLRRTERGGAAADWAQHQLTRRGGPLVAIGRFIPGGQTAISLTAGTLAYPPGRYLTFAVIGAAIWTTYGTVLGAYGGQAVGAGNWLGLALAVATALLLTVGPRLLSVLRARQPRRKRPRQLNS